MRRFYLPPDQCQAPMLALEGREAHHALHVLRVAPGELVTVLDGAGQEMVCEVANCQRQHVQLRVVEKKQQAAWPWQITLLQAIPKAGIIEDIIQKAVELGVHRIVPLLSDRVVLRLADDTAEAKTVKWQSLAVEAIKQCGNPWLPQVERPLTPKAFIERNESFDLAMIGSLMDEPRRIRDHVENFRAMRQRLPKTICVWIGPEGDFTPSEVGLAKTAGALPISLGRLVLRCETAAIYCLAVLSHELSFEKGARPS
ncbi:MAG: RsmE family RNA methyltransferase [Verrucomicrobia bacterium]|nr:RsmE family RNA methyltransferase [Verrucomicrobiota bacterium]